MDPIGRGRWCVDLTWPVRERFGDLPGHPPTKLTSFHSHETHGRSNACLTLSIHTGTHLDAPYHFFPDGVTIDRLEMERLACRSILLDLVGRVGPARPISLELVQQAMDDLGVTDILGRGVLFRTGWGESMYGSDGYYSDNPYLSQAAAAWLSRSGVTLVGLDFPPDSIGKTMVVPAPAPVHEILLGAGVPILENLANLDRLPERAFHLTCLPLKLEGAGGAPVRAVAWSRG